jgi:hypothetical protein
MKRKLPRPATTVIMSNAARLAGHAQSIGAGQKAINRKKMRSKYLMKDTALRWNNKRARYEKMLAAYVAKGGVVTRLPTTFEDKANKPQFSFIIGPDVLRRPGYSHKIEECRNAPKPVKNG